MQQLLRDRQKQNPTIVSNNQLNPFLNSALKPECEERLQTLPEWCFISHWKMQERIKTRQTRWQDQEGGGGQTPGLSDFIWNIYIALIWENFLIIIPIQVLKFIKPHLTMQPVKWPFLYQCPCKRRIFDCVWVHEFLYFKNMSLKTYAATCPWYPHFVPSDSMEMDRRKRKRGGRRETKIKRCL